MAMSFLFKIFKKNKQPQPRYEVKRDSKRPGIDDTYRITDTKENLKFELEIFHETYDSGCIERAEEPDGKNNSVRTYVGLTIGSDYPGPNKDKYPVITRSVRIYDTQWQKAGYKHLPTYDDTDFAILNKIKAEMADNTDTKRQQHAFLLYTMLKAVDSDILTSETRISEEYKTELKRKKQQEEEQKQAFYQQEKYKREKERLQKEAAQKEATQKHKQDLEVKTDIYVQKLMNNNRSY